MVNKNKFITRGKQPRHTVSTQRKTTYEVSHQILQYKPKYAVEPNKDKENNTLKKTKLLPPQKNT